MAAVLFVCLGNICRSPTAHSVFEHLVRSEGLQNRIQVDSAGTAGWHVGKSPDARARQFASKRGYEMEHLRAREVSRRDFEDYDVILAMDNENLRVLESLCEPSMRHKLRLFLDFAEGAAHREVPDPYYGGDEGFELVLDLVENASQGLLKHMRQHHSI